MTGSRIHAFSQRLFRLLARAFRFKSLSLALWADAYESHKPTHGGK